MRGRESLVDTFLDVHPRDAAALLATMPVSEAVGLLEHVSAESAARAIRLMPMTLAAECLAIAPSLTTSVTPFLSLETVGSLVRSMSQSQQKTVLDAVPPSLRGQLTNLLRYPANAVGAVMDRKLPAVPLKWTIAQVVERLPEIVFGHCPYVYVVDDNAVLVGALKIDELDPSDNAPVERRMTRNVVRVPAFAHVSSVMEHVGWHRHDFLPVVADRGSLVGVLRHKRVRGSQMGEVKTEEGDGLVELFLTLGEAYWTGLWAALSAVSSAEGRASGLRGDR